MDLKKLDTSSLNKAVKSLAKAVDAYEKDPANEFIRDAMIQRFEYTYELSHKMLKRYLEITEPNAKEIDHMSFPSLIRTGSERGLLLNDWETWKNFRHARNMTSYVYDEKKAHEVVLIIPEFLDDSLYLLNKIDEMKML